MKFTKGLMPSISVSCCACFAFIVWGCSVANAAKGNVDRQNDFVYLYHPMVGPLVAWLVFILSSASKKFWIPGIGGWPSDARNLYIYCGLLIFAGVGLLWKTLQDDSLVMLSTPLLVYLALTMNLAGYYWGVVPPENSILDKK